MTYTSTLSVADLQLTRDRGFRPLRQVMGSCFYHVGYQVNPRTSLGIAGNGLWPGYPNAAYIELETQTHAWNEARSLALARMTEEARACGADAVVAVSVTRGSHDWARGMVEFIATGTAVRSERYDLGETAPVLSSLSGTELAALLAHGWWPAGIVGSSTVMYVISGWQTSRIRSLGPRRLQNIELEELSDGVLEARNTVFTRLVRQRHELAATGIIAVTYDQDVERHEADGRLDIVVTLHVLGTAITEYERAGEDPPVYLALPLADKA